MNRLIDQMQQAYEQKGREGARQTFLAGVEELDWTEEELREAVQVLRSYPKQ